MRRIGVNSFFICVVELTCEAIHAYTFICWEVCMCVCTPNSSLLLVIGMFQLSSASTASAGGIFLEICPFLLGCLAYNYNEYSFKFFVTLWSQLLLSFHFLICFLEPLSFLPGEPGYSLISCSYLFILPALGFFALFYYFLLLTLGFLCSSFSNPFRR